MSLRMKEVKLRRQEVRNVCYYWKGPWACVAVSKLKLTRHRFGEMGGVA
jgi:hypothetical protein